MRATISLVPLVALLAASTAAAQDPNAIASRVRAAGGGEVRMQYAARPGTCGDGKDVISFRHAFFATNMQGFGTMNGVRCEPGPVRVSLRMLDGAPVEVTTRVGGAWSTAGTGVTDLGTVSSRDAAVYFLTVLPRLETGTRREKGRLLLPVVLAADADVVPALLALGRDEARVTDTRRQAIQWAGMLGDARTVPALVTIARGANDEGGRVMHGGMGVSMSPEKDGKKGIASAAAAALSWIPDGAGIPALIQLAGDGSVAVRRQAVFWLAQTDDERAHRAVRDRAADSNEDARVREHAVFSLAHGEATEADRRWLRDLYARVDDEGVRKAILMGMQQDESPEAGRWLIEKVRDANATLEVRKTAAFWAGQRDATPTSELVAAYKAVDGRALKEHLIFVLSQRDDDAATDALVTVVRTDGDPRMRQKALFWLGQKDDPRAAKLIAELLAK